MKKDIAAKGLLEHSNVFADIANVNLFGGRQFLIHPEQLLDLLSVLSGDKRMRAMREALLQIEKREETSMCLLMDIMERDYKEKGLAEGLEQGIRGAVQLLQRLGLDEAEILKQISYQFSLPIDTVRTFL